MYEIITETLSISGVSILLGRGVCNARCSHCAGMIHRKTSPLHDNIPDLVVLEKILRLCHARGAKSFSVSSAGEPTLSPIAVTETLRLVDRLAKESILYDRVNLYTNGIRIGRNEEFAKEYLSLWQSLGLKWLYITIHSANEEENALFYGVKKYPQIQKIINRSHEAGLLVRANVVLSKKNVAKAEQFKELVQTLQTIGVDAVSAWPIRTDDDREDVLLIPDERELRAMKQWVSSRTSRDIPVRILTKKDHEKYALGEKLTLFPNGVLSNTWCN